MVDAEDGTSTGGNTTAQLSEQDANASPRLPNARGVLASRPDLRPQSQGDDGDLNNVPSPSDEPDAKPTGFPPDFNKK